MYGRNGVDSLGKFVLAISIIVMLLAGWTDSLILSYLSWIGIIYLYFRMFSRNIYKRSSENQWYLNKSYKIRTFFYRQKIRVPRGKGRIEIRCPKCNTRFIKKS